MSLPLESLGVLGVSRRSTFSQFSRRISARFQTMVFEEKEVRACRVSRLMYLPIPDFGCICIERGMPGIKPWEGASWPLQNRTDAAVHEMK
jgi:hypothetical protein